MNIEGV